MSDVIFNCANVSKTYHDGTNDVHVLKDINLSIHSGDRIAIIGPSGSGKSTLLHLLGGLDKPSSGVVSMQGNDWHELTEKKRCQLRNHALGFIYQFHHLLPEFSALENVSMPLLLAGQAVVDVRQRALAMLEQVNLSHRVTHKPAQLSGGERQRVAIARALVHQPACVLADEPTGNLDQSTAATVFDLMMRLNEQQNTALIIVTHDIRLAERMDRVLTLQEGVLVEA